jgi:hypothetical protein
MIIQHFDILTKQTITKSRKWVSEDFDIETELKVEHTQQKYENGCKKAQIDIETVNNQRNYASNCEVL